MRDVSSDPEAGNQAAAGAAVIGSAGEAAADVGATRPTLAARLAERSRQRAERLARLRPAPAEAGRPVDDEAEAALREFLRALTGDLPPPPPAPAAAEVLAFQRPERPMGGATGGAAVSDLESLPGVGPNLVWVLEQAGIGCLADLVPLEPTDLVSRLGPIGRLVPAAGWIAVARAGMAPG
jgi:hypothetical protein